MVDGAGVVGIKIRVEQPQVSVNRKLQVLTYSLGFFHQELVYSWCIAPGKAKK